MRTPRTQRTQAMYSYQLLQVPLAKRGEPTEGGICKLWLRSWYKGNITRTEPKPCTLVK